MLDSAFILLFIISFVDLALGFFVFIKNPRQKVNSSFAVLSFSLLVWINASFFEDEVHNVLHMLFLLKLDYASGIIAAFSLLLFCLNISKAELANRHWFRKVIIIIPAIASLLIFFTGSVLSGYEIISGIIIPRFGMAYPIYVLLIGTSLLLGLGTLIAKYKKSSNEDKASFIYLFLGLFLSSIIAFVTNILLSDGIKDNLYSRFGSFSTIFVVLFSGYAIIKHRLFNLKVLAAETLSLGILVFSLIQLLRSDTAEFFANGIVFLVLLVFVIMLVRSVEDEVKRKEELQLLYDQLGMANDRLRELDQARAEFMSMASHQLRTPLTAIKGFSSLLLEKSAGSLTTGQEDMITKIAVSSERMAQLVEDYLNLTRIESGKLEYKFEKWRLENICQEVVDTLALKAKEKNLYLNYMKPSRSLPEVMVDGPKIREVISNLVDNAIKYTPEGGVTVAMELRPRKADKEPDLIRITVSDTGMGMRSSDIPNLFAKFSRLKDEQHNTVKGTGLGLYVGKVMIENIGGKIWAESDGVGKGSRFIVEIPQKRPDMIPHREGSA